MASIRQRQRRDGTTSYAVLFRHDGRQRAETFDDRSEAEWFRDLIHRHDIPTALRALDERDGLTTEDDHLTVAEHLRRHTDTLSGITDGTRRKYQAIVRDLTDHPIGTLPLTSLTRADVTTWVRHLEARGLSGKTVTFRKTYLSGALKQAVIDELIPRNPADGVKVTKTERREPVFLSPDEFDAILTAAEPEWRPLLITLAGTGIRIGEATALRVWDLTLNTDPPSLRVARGWEWTHGGGHKLGAPKTARGRRTIALGADVAAVLADIIAGRPGEDWLFTHDGGPVRRHHIAPRWARWVRDSGITRRPRLHDLRHAHASWMIAKGYPLNDLSHRLGHASIKVTADTYGHLAHDAQTRAAALAYLGLGGAQPQIGR